RAIRVAIRTKEIYRSPNGDRWLLARDPDTGRPFVMHEPNLPPRVAKSPILRSEPLERTREARTPAPDWNDGLGVPSTVPRLFRASIRRDRPKCQLIPKIRLLSERDSKRLVSWQPRS